MYIFMNNINPLTQNGSSMA